eukprot:Gregarina_sp_Pseudo_9__198@NODE_112_length_4197_cov_53_172439_g104_i0_p1_GENE_NODE_112_length_4197_cov_53_172439_g104_i0NODE_112_length_4197_cov_53_172439_g104_i0_p1_ORF_typecomplete_len417_score26_61NIF/PF03031_18/1_1e32HAD_2/PF13419_6/0_0011HAD/PF12710_7/0_0067Acid_phosphat_B/PF03767_14/0_0033DUF705/PF05152_12/4_9DUF705/PF05152_12/2NT5C/PF06941_12/6_9e02NT5C/PF06941_12/0_025DUF2608/PF11019_8/0_31_NODE_112_length_4197_cov_53_172439_g104_i011612411
MSGSVVVPRGYASGGVWRQSDSTELLKDKPASATLRRSSPSKGKLEASLRTTDSNNIHSKFHNKFFRLTKRFLRSEGSSNVCDSSYSRVSMSAGGSGSRSSDGSHARKLRRRFDTTSVPIYVSFPSVSSKTTRLSFYDQARAEAVSLTYACPRLSDASLLTKASLGSFELDKPPTETRLTVVLDLDETLVHTIANYSCSTPGERSSQRADDPPPSMTVFYRPFVVSFLRALKKMQCEVIVFTAGTQSYTDAVLDVLDPYHALIDHRLYRQQASGHPLRSNVLCKNLQLLGRDLDSCVLIDDNPDTFCLQPENGWAISPYGKRLAYSDVGSILYKGTEADYRRFCPPAVLEGRNSRSGGIANKLVVGCTREDYALLNALCLLKELLSSGLSVPKFTTTYEKKIAAALLGKTDALFCP